MQQQMYITTLAPGAPVKVLDAENVTPTDRLRGQVQQADETAARTTDWTERTRAEQAAKTLERELHQRELQARTDLAGNRKSLAEIEEMANSTDPATRSRALLLHVQHAACAGRKEVAARLAARNRKTPVVNAETFAPPVAYYAAQ